MRHNTTPDRLELARALVAVLPDSLSVAEALKGRTADQAASLMNARDLAFSIIRRTEQ